MSLTIFPNSFNIGFNQQVNSPPALPPTGPFIHSDNQAPSEALMTIKIIPNDDEGVQEDAVDLTQRRFNRRTKFEVDFETKEVTAKVVDAETGEEIKQIPDERLQKISKSISEYTARLKEFSESARNIQEEPDILDDIT